MSQYIRIEKVDHEDPVAGATFYYDLNDPDQRYVVTGPIIQLNPDYEAAGQAAWRIVAEEDGTIDTGFKWEDLTASDDQTFWIEVGKAAVAAALRTLLKSDGTPL